MIEEERRRDQEREQRWEPVPLHAPSPVAPDRRRDDRRSERREESANRGVVIIDMNDYSETRI